MNLFRSAFLVVCASSMINAVDLTTQVSVGASDIDVPAQTLTYTWSVVTKPATSSSVTFATRTLAAGEITAGFTNGQTVSLVNATAGTYTFRCSVSDGVAPPVTSDVNVTVSANVAPTITTISNQTVNEDTATGDLAFTVADTVTPAASLTVTASSSNKTLVPDANVVITPGVGGARTVKVTPAANAFGTTTITLTVSDGTSTSTTTFVVNVTSVNDAPTITQGAAATPASLSL